MIKKNFIQPIKVNCKMLILWIPLLYQFYDKPVYQSTGANKKSYFQHILVSLKTTEA